MDRHVRWLRRRIVPRVLMRLLIEWLVVVDIALVAILFIAVDPFVAVPWALLAGVVWVVLRVSVALFVNPINWPFLSQYIDEPVDVQPMTARPDDAVADEDLPFLASHNLTHEVDLRSHDSYVSVFGSPDGRVLAVLGPGETVPTFVSLLSDGRLLITGNQLMVPHEELVVNHDRRRDARWLVERHVDLLEELHGEDLSPVPSNADSVARLMRIEHDGWAQLGPFIGPFLDIGTRFAPHLLTVRVAAPQLLERTREPIAARHLDADIVSSGEQPAATQPIEAAIESADDAVVETADDVVVDTADDAVVETSDEAVVEPADEGVVMQIGRRAATDGDASDLAA